MDLFEKTLFKKEIYNGNFFTVEKLSVLLPDGNTSTRDIVRHCGAVAIIAVTQDEKILFVCMSLNNYLVINFIQNSSNIFKNMFTFSFQISSS
ncbi:Putative ADP-ribose pyrophosphatase [Candidatus Arthromitus sp. SFB-5]|nr:Putative ADP-ribose pyrophosphatase [Candidatus Arthromitus sp. SFB-5]